jgi:hypothetical protein
MSIIPPSLRRIKAEAFELPPKRRPHHAHGDVVAAYRDGLRAVEAAWLKWTTAKKDSAADPQLVADAADAFNASQDALGPARDELAKALAELVRAAAGIRDPLMKSILHLLRDLPMAEVLA